MAMVVQHNLTAMNSNRMLGITTGAQAKSTEKLSSGYKINRAADDAAGLTISEKMRKQMRGLDRASTNAQDGISAVQTAEGALTEVHSMLQRMNELAVQAANGTNSEDDRQAIQDEIDQLVTEIDRVSETTKFNEIYLLKGGEGTTTETVGTYKYELTDAAKAAQEATITVVGNAYAGGETNAITASADATEASMTVDTTALTAIAAGTNLYADDGAGGGYVKVTDANIGNFFTIDAAGTTVTAKTGVGFRSATSDADATGNIGSAANVTVANAPNYVTPHAPTAAVEGNIDKYIEVGDDNTLKYKDGMVLYQSPAVATGNDYGDQVEADKILESDLGNYFSAESNPLADKDGKKITDVSSYFIDGVYQGGIYRMTDVNGDGKLVWADDKKEIGADQIADWVTVTEPKTVEIPASLQFNLHVGSESALDNKIGVEIKSISSKGIGIDGLKGTGLMTEDDATNAIDTIASAISLVSKQRSALGAIQNRLEHTIANLDNVVENTTAAESRIRDTDMAEEMVEYSKNNILAQAGQSMLAQANQSTQGVLSLLG